MVSPVCACYHSCKVVLHDYFTQAIQKRITIVTNKDLGGQDNKLLCYQLSSKLCQVCKYHTLQMFVTRWSNFSTEQVWYHWWYKRAIGDQFVSEVCKWCHHHCATSTDCVTFKLQCQLVWKTCIIVKISSPVPLWIQVVALACWKQTSIDFSGRRIISLRRSPTVIDMITPGRCQVDARSPSSTGFPAEQEQRSRSPTPNIVWKIRQISK